MSSFVFGRNPRLTLVRILVLVIAAVVVVKTILLPVRLQGISMLPAYRSGTLNVANRIAYLWRAPARGDVIAIRMAGPSVVYVKRIVGLPGERLRFQNFDHKLHRRVIVIEQNHLVERRFGGLRLGAGLALGDGIAIAVRPSPLPSPSVIRAEILRTKSAIAPLSLGAPRPVC